jgi:endonuclease YncB( thermonuclease family)
MTRTAIAVLAALILVPASAAAADNLAGQASVIDGDTLEIHGTRIRLWGVDAPESSQLCRGEDSLQYRCGAKAANELDAFIAKRPVDCIPISLDQYRRTVATCSVDGVDLADWLVRNGLALDWPNIPRANSTLSSAKLNTLGVVFGGVATSSLGYIEYASEPAEVQPIAQTMRTHTPKNSRRVG